MDVEGFLASVYTAPWYEGQIVHRESIPPRHPQYFTRQLSLAPRLEKALKSLSRYPLYEHQGKAISLIKEGKHIIVATPAASGKSLCYHLPVLESLLEDPSSTALYLYPTKALAQDQLRGLKELSQAAGLNPAFGTYDGDTPQEERTILRRSGRIILTNPDMLSLGVLPNHKSWSRLLQHLKFVVADEAHVYRGVFGSHVANIFRRLRRLCNRYGSHPQFILCSATLANSRELAQRLTGLAVDVINVDGSPSGGKEFLFWNPPLIDEARSARRSTNSEATRLFAHLLHQSVRTIAFARTRRLVELIYLYVKERLAEVGSPALNRVKPYRAGYLPEDRRQIERELFNGELLGVSATNALELGIDVGDLDATVLAGYPGTIASAWQQAGRSGRRGGKSLSILVAQDNPLDQYLMNHSEAFFGRPHENALISPENPHILKPHLICAAYEMPLREEEEDLFSSTMLNLTKELESEGLLRGQKRQWFLSPQVEYPAQEVNIRSTSPNSYLLIDEESGAVIETVESAIAFSQVHPGAMYLHQGEGYLVRRLDIEGHRAFATRSKEPYYTVTSDLTDISIIQVRTQKKVGPVQVYLGDVKVTHQVVSFKRKKQLTEEVITEEPLDLPSTSFSTVALWFDIPLNIQEEARKGKVDLPGGLHAAEHAAIGVLPLFAMCDRADIGGVSTPLHPDTGKPQIFIYDGHPGGVGITEKGFEIIEELWKATLEITQKCPCESGCPSCIQSPKCGNNNEPLDKGAARMLLSECLSR